MERLTEKVGDKIRFTAKGNRIYCSSQAMAELVHCYEEQLEKKISEQGLKDDIITSQQIITHQTAMLAAMNAKLEEVEQLLATL